MQTVSFFYDDYKKVQGVLIELEKFGVPASATKMVACDADERYRTAPLTHTTTDDALFGAAIGGVAGIASGAMAAMGVLEAPGFEPMVSMGVLAASAAAGIGGALIGWLSGSLTHFIYARGVPAGSGTLITVQTSNERAGFVESILRRGLAITPPKRLGGYLDRSRTFDGSSSQTVRPIETRIQRSNFQS